MNITKKDNKEFTKDLLQDLQIICDSIENISVENIIKNNYIYVLQKNVNQDKERKHKFFIVIVEQIHKACLHKDFKRFSIYIAILNYIFFEQKTYIKICINIHQLEQINAFIMDKNLLSKQNVNEAFFRFILGCLNQLKVADSFFVYIDKYSEVIRSDDAEDLLAELKYCEEQLEKEDVCKNNT